MAEENPADLGGLSIPTGAPSSTHTVDGATSASEEVIKTRKRRSDAGSARGARGEKPASSIPVLSPDQFKALYSPELWGRITTAPAEGMAFATGKKYWQPSEEEKKTLGATCSIAAQCFAVTDPRWLAAAAALITLGNFYATRLAMHISDKRLEKKAEEKPAA